MSINFYFYFYLHLKSIHCYVVYLSHKYFNLIFMIKFKFILFLMFESYMWPWIVLMDVWAQHGFSRPRQCEQWFWKRSENSRNNCFELLLFFSYSVNVNVTVANAWIWIRVQCMNMNFTLLSALMQQDKVKGEMDLAFWILVSLPSHFRITS